MTETVPLLLCLRVLASLPCSRQPERHSRLVLYSVDRVGNKLDHAVSLHLIRRDPVVQGRCKHGLDEALSITDDGSIAICVSRSDLLDGQDLSGSIISRSREQDIRISRCRGRVSIPFEPGRTREGRDEDEQFSSAPVRLRIFPNLQN